MKKVFTPEKVRELADNIVKSVCIANHLRDDIEYELHKWFEQNPIEPVVEVGQVWSGTASFFEVTIIGINSTLLVYQDNKTKSFRSHEILDFVTKFERVS